MVARLPPSDVRHSALAEIAVEPAWHTYHLKLGPLLLHDGKDYLIKNSRLLNN